MTHSSAALPTGECGVLVYARGAVPAVVASYQPDAPTSMHAISDDQWQSVAISETLGEPLGMHLW